MLILSTEKKNAPGWLHVLSVSSTRGAGDLTLLWMDQLMDQNWCVLDDFLQAGDVLSRLEMYLAATRINPQESPRRFWALAQADIPSVETPKEADNSRDSCVLPHGRRDTRVWNRWSSMPIPNSPRISITERSSWTISITRFYDQ